VSLALIKAAVLRFLASADPEVLCITGRWGVGKTYAWKNFLREAAQKEGQIALGKSSYVSLFGLNSLEDLRYAIFENTITTRNLKTGPTDDTIKENLKKVSERFRRFRPGLELLSSVFRMTGVADIAFKSAFSLTRNQIVCFDDLERRGNELGILNVMGLASFLKEERDCKVVLLLNEEMLGGNDKKNFQANLEKVADVTLKFDLTSQEAVNIALPKGRQVDELLRPRIVELGINNIRVIKKIERLAAKLVDHLKGFDLPVREQAIATVVLGSWSIQQPGIAPPLDFIRKYNRMAIGMAKNDEQLDPDRENWQNAIVDYPYVHTDDMDAVILDGAATGYFDEEELEARAAANQEQLRHHSRDNSFSKAWSDLYHGSLATDDDEFLDALYRGAIENLEITSPVNLNVAVRMLRQYDREDQADKLVAKYVVARKHESIEFFNLDNNHFFSPDDPIDEVFRKAFKERYSNYVDPRVPIDVLRSMGERQSWDQADIALMAKQSVDDFEAMFEALRGDEVRRSIDMVLTLGRANYPESETINATATDALRRIASKSPMRRTKVQRYGVHLES
jgi:hypothetical protein